MVTMFIDTLKPPFSEHILGSVSSISVDIVIIRERIKLGIKSRKITHGSSAVTNPKRSNPERKEGEVQVTSNILHYNSHTLLVPNNLYQ